MKRNHLKRWFALAVICLPLIGMAVVWQMARRADAARRHLHALNMALFQAAQENAVPEVEHLLAQSATADAVEQYEEPDASLPALWQQWWNRLKGAPAESAQSDTERTAFSAALESASQSQFKDWRVLKLLVDHGANVNELPTQGANQTALDWTTELKDWATTNYLLEKGANPNITGMHGSNPFLQTVACDNVAEATKMLAKGAKVNFVPKESGETPLGIALIHENPTMIHLLLDHGADINLPDSQGDTPLLRCRGNEKAAELTALLLEKGADPNRQNKEGDTPLMKAAHAGDLEMARLYLGHKADAHIRNKKGLTALELAQSQHNTALIALLTQASGTP